MWNVTESWKLVTRAQSFKDSGASLGKTFKVLNLILILDLGFLSQEAFLHCHLVYGLLY